MCVGEKRIKRKNYQIEKEGEQIQKDRLSYLQWNVNTRLDNFYYINILSYNKISYNKSIS